MLAIFCITFFFIYGSIWHLSLLFSTPFSILEMQKAFVVHIYTYALLSYVLGTLLVLMKWRWVKWAAAILFAISLSIRILNWNVFYFYGNHVDQLFWQFAFQGKQSSGMALTASSIISFLVAISFYFSFVLGLRWVERHKKSYNWSLLKTIVLPLVVVGLLAGAMDGISRMTFESKKSRRVDGKNYLDRVPEHLFFRSLYRYVFQKEELSEKDLPDQKFAQRLEKRGIRLYSNGRQYPLHKDSIYLSGKLKELPRQRVGTNIIMVIAESYSSYFVNNKRITPNINRFKKFSRSFEIYNAATPTYHGTIALLASQLYLYKSTINTVRKHKDIEELYQNKVDGGRTRYQWLSDILKDYNYENYYVHGSDGAFANLEATLNRHSFDTIVTDATPELQKMAKKEKALWGYSDEDLFDYVISILRNRDQKKTMFMVIDTADIHHPYQYHHKLEGVESGVLNCAYSTDKAFGKLFDYLELSGKLDNTIVIFTADHAIFPTVPYMKLRPNFRSSYYDLTPFIVHSPGLKPGKSEVTGSSLDAVPTILDLLGLDIKNSFLGLSLLSERAQYPMIWGLNNLNNHISAQSWSDRDQEQFIRFLKYLTYTDRLVPHN